MRKTILHHMLVVLAAGLFLFCILTALIVNFRISRRTQDDLAVVASAMAMAYDRSADAQKQADELAARLRGLQCHVNLIPLNDVKERNLHAPEKVEVAAFLRRLNSRGVSATVRREMGADIDGACGQLRRKALASPADLNH